jgi:hypothetical protein
LLHECDIRVPVCHDRISKDLEIVSESLKREVFVDLAEKAVTLTTDGTTDRNMTFYVIVGVTRDRVYFIELAELTTSDHQPA